MQGSYFEGKVAVITGGGSGIGQAIATELARLGCHLALVDIKQQSLDETQTLLGQYKRNISTHVCDVSNKEEMAKLPESIIARHEHIDLLFNNAGIVLEKTFESQTIEEWELLVGINLWGVIYGSKYFLPYLKARPESHIVNTSSLAGFLGLPTQTAYCASKAAVKAISEAMYAECKPHNVHVTSIHPGAISTNLFALAIEHSDDPEASKKMFDMVDKFAMKPEKAAQKIVRAVAKKKIRVVVGMDAYAVEFFKRLLPVSIHRVFAWGFSKR